jgi:hypothetical protein
LSIGHLLAGHAIKGLQTLTVEATAPVFKPDSPFDDATTDLCCK